MLQKKSYSHTRIATPGHYKKILHHVTQSMSINSMYHGKKNDIKRQQIAFFVSYLTIGSSFSVHHRVIIRVMVHLESLESTRAQEARVAHSYRLKQLLRFFRALQTASNNSNASFVLSKIPSCTITRWAR